MARILSIETTTKICSVAIHENERLIVLKELHLDKSHSEHLIPMIQEIAKSASLNMEGLDAIALSSGPGSYTGLRIGSSTAKGLCYALNIPLIAVSTLEAMAKQIVGVFDNKMLLCPMLDARRMEVYAAIYTNSFEQVMEVQPVIIDENSFAEYLMNYSGTVFFGNGAEKCKPILGENAYYIDDITPSAKTVGELAFAKFENKEFEDVAYYEPFYLKEFRPTTPKLKQV